MLPASSPMETARHDSVLSDPMPTASTDSSAADVRITEEALPDTLPSDTAELTPQQPQADAMDGLNGLGAFIEDQLPGDQVLVEDPEAPSQKIVATLPEADAAPPRLVLKAKAPVWVRVEDSQGNVVMTQMLMTGDTYGVPNREGLVVIARDGGLLTYMIDGVEKGILGTPGEILVGRSLDLSSFES
jgi:cytoskeleton protein RodZ